MNAVNDFCSQVALNGRCGAGNKTACDVCDLAAANAQEHILGNVACFCKCIKRRLRRLPAQALIVQSLLREGLCTRGKLAGGDIYLVDLKDRDQSAIGMARPRLALALKVIGVRQSEFQRLKKRSGCLL